MLCRRAMGALAWRARRLLAWLSVGPVPLDRLFPHARRIPVSSGGAALAAAGLEAGERFPTPEAMTLPLARVAARRARCVEWVLPTPWVAELPHALYSPDFDLILDDRRRVLAESMSGDMVNRWRIPIRALRHMEIAELPLPPGAAAREAPVTASLFRSAMRGHYHTLIDHLPRVCLLEGLAASLAPIWLLHGDPLTPVERHLLDRLCPAGVRPLAVAPGRLYRVERLLFPSFASRGFGGAVPRGYRALLLARVAPPRPRRPTRRLWISRADAPKGRGVVNEAEVVARLERYGFERVALEGLSFAEQAELFYDAEAIVGPHGAGLTNALFADRALMVELFASPAVYPHFYFLARSVGHRYAYLLGDGASRDDAFTVDVDALEQTLVATGLTPAPSSPGRGLG